MLFKSEIITKTWDTWMAYHQGTYYLYYLTSEHAVGDGFGESDDGLHRQALEPPRIAWGDPPEMIFVEVGGVHEFDQRYYCIAGDYASTNCGMFTLVADSPSGPFRPAPKNFGLLRNQSKMHAYFTRFLDTPDGVLVNHHTLAERQFSDDHFVVTFAPLKRATIIDGGLYLTWWRSNDKLKHVRGALPQGNEGDLRVSVETGLVLEGRLTLPGGLFIGTRGDAGVWIRVDDEGVTEIGPGTRDGTCSRLKAEPPLCRSCLKQLPVSLSLSRLATTPATRPDTARA